MYIFFIMTSFANFNFMRIHFTWINWSLEYQKSFRNRILKSSEEERIEIAKHLGVDNAFLIRRNKDVAFKNLIFYRILSDKEIYRKVMPKISEILTQSIMYEEDIIRSLESKVPKANMISPIDTPLEIFEKLAGTDFYAIKYLQQLLKYYLDNEDIENAANVQSYLKEYSTSRFFVSELFITSFPYEESSHPVLYEFILKSFLVENLDNNVLYDTTEKPFYYHPIDLENLFAYPLKEKLRVLVFQVLDVEESVETISQYPMFFNNLLSVASMLYFTDLSLEEKLKLLNTKFELNDLITLLHKYDFKWDFWIWKLANSYLNKNGFHDLALDMYQIILDSYLDKVEDSEKYSLFESLATVYRNLKNYEKAILYYEKAYNWINQASLRSFFKDIKGATYDKPEYNLEYQRGVCLKNIGECYGHFGNLDKMKEFFLRVEELIHSLKASGKKFALYKNLTIASKRLRDFELERKYLKKAINYIDETISIPEIEDIEDRIKTFEETRMSQKQLSSLEHRKEIEELVKNGVFLQKTFSFNLSIKFFKSALQFSKNYSLKKYIKIIYLRLALSYFYIKDWEHSRSYFEKLLIQQKDFQSESYYFILLIITNNKEKSKNKLEEIYQMYKENRDNLSYFNFWFKNLMNSLKKAKFILLLPMLNDLEDQICEFFLRNFGYLLAENGFSDLAIKFFNNELEYIEDEIIQATIYNDIAGVYSDLGEHDKAITFYKKAIELDNDFDLAYRNLAQIYARKQDYENAKNIIEKAILVAEVGRKEAQIQVYKKELLEFNSFWKTIINIFNIENVEIKNILKTSERKILDYRNKDDSFDASDIILGYSKALEKMFDEKVASHFTPLIDKFKNKYKKGHTTNDFNLKFGWLIENKYITLGKWIRIINDFQNKQKDPDLEEFRICLKTVFNDDDLEIIQKTCESIVNIRNRIAHSEVLTINQVKNYRMKIIPHLNKTIDILYPFKEI